MDPIEDFSDLMMRKATTFLRNLLKKTLFADHSTIICREINDNKGKAIALIATNESIALSLSY